MKLKRLDLIYNVRYLWLLFNGVNASGIHQWYQS
jgi:hypothetical protein